jgi:WbqC-like protein family
MTIQLSMDTYLHPTYFPNISHFVGIANADNIVFEVEDNYQKQTYRNRTHIYGANGKLSLSIPVKHTHKNRQIYKDVKIINDTNWQLSHWKSLQSAYRTSPFFEFYEDELAPLFHEKHNYILEFNFKCINIIADCLQLDLNYETTSFYKKEIPNSHDLRFLVNARKESEQHFEPYTQVFSNKHGYINNLSILDLLFNEGTNALSYLHSQKLEL